MFLREKQLRQNVRFATQAQINSKSRQAKENGLQNTLSVLLRALAKTSLLTFVQTLRVSALKLVCTLQWQE